MIVTWTSALVLATNLVFAMAVGVDVLSLLAAFAGATVAGGVFGEPLLEGIGQASIIASAFCTSACKVRPACTTTTT